jgi:hypothetical protein
MFIKDDAKVPVDLRLKDPSKWSNDQQDAAKHLGDDCD